MRGESLPHNWDITSYEEYWAVQAGLFFSTTVVGFESKQEAERFARYLVDIEGYSKWFIEVDSYWRRKGWTTG